MDALVYLEADLTINLLEICEWELGEVGECVWLASQEIYNQ